MRFRQPSHNWESPHQGDVRRNGSATRCRCHCGRSVHVRSRCKHSRIEGRSRPQRYGEATRQRHPWPRGRYRPRQSNRSARVGLLAIDVAESFRRRGGYRGFPWLRRDRFKEAGIGRVSERTHFVPLVFGYGDLLQTDGPAARRDHDHGGQRRTLPCRLDPKATGFRRLMFR